MAPGMGIKAPVPRTRTGCLTCRGRKVKCDDVRPGCGRCVRLKRVCEWAAEKQHPGSVITNSSTKAPALHLSEPSGQNFIVEFSNLDRQTISYMRHFITFCCRFIAYPNDSEGNPFQEKLVPLATSSPALLHAITAISAAHLSRFQKQHDLTAAHHYSLALPALNSTLSNPTTAKSDSTLAACLLLCVYEIIRSDKYIWHGHHLAGARDLILYRGGPKTTDCLTRFFSLLDVSGSVSSGSATLLQGNYWLEDDAYPSTVEENGKRWPYYDTSNIMVSRYLELMTYMARLSRLSAKGLSDLGLHNPAAVENEVWTLHSDLITWWRGCESRLIDQTTDWRQLQRPRKLTVPETLEEEAFSKCKCCMKGCVIYLYHILDPVGCEPQNDEVIEAISFILETAREIPEGFGFEMGLYWAFFMAGIAIFNDVVAEALIRHKLKSGNSLIIYNAERALELLEVLWKRQHQYGKKYDWRQVQVQMGIQVYIHPADRRLNSILYTY